MNHTPDVFHRGGAFFEAPRWHDGKWFLSDVYQEAVLAYSPNGIAEMIMEVPGQPSGLGWMSDGTMLVVSMIGRKVLYLRPTGESGEHSDLSAVSRGYVNDMVVDGRDRAWVGCFGYIQRPEYPVVSTLLRIDPDGSSAVVADDLYFPNGTVILPDEETLVVGETTGNRYTAFSISQDGTLGDRRVWARFGPSPSPASGYNPPTAALVNWTARTGRPDEVPVTAVDGCCVDEEGCIWAADMLGRRCIRVREGGAIVDEIRAPAGMLYIACMLGDDDGRSLLICASPSTERDRQLKALDAELHIVRVDVPRSGRP